jgi:hypothetical protein
MLLFTHQEDQQLATEAMPLGTTMSRQNVWLLSARPERLAVAKEIPPSPNEAFSEAGKLPATGESYKWLAVSLPYTIEAQTTQSWRMVRTVKPGSEELGQAINDSQNLMRANVQVFVRANEELYRRVPRFRSPHKLQALVYYSAVNMMWQQILPPEGKCHTNYHVVSREPVWGLGRSGQTMHESLTMQAYAAIDPVSAMNCLRTYRERQTDSGYLFYRLGPYLDDNALGQERATTAFPLYASIVWEIYKTSKDRKFLQEMYDSAKNFYEYVVKQRDSDQDGLCEWSGQAAKESGRNNKSVIWEEVGDAGEVEALDMNCLLAREEESLAAMAKELGLEAETKLWREAEARRAQKINTLFWDEDRGFYFHIAKDSHTFGLKKTDDLKREEIIGFLPLWAGIVTPERAQRLIAKLRDSGKFWRRYGIPSLAADDKSYDPKGYWNGPVWIPWNYLLAQGLARYGYNSEAKELTGKVADAVAAQLTKNHDFWECYSPDSEWAGHHSTCLWSGMISKMLLDFAEKEAEK